MEKHIWVEFLCASFKIYTSWEWFCFSRSLFYHFTFLESQCHIMSTTLLLVWLFHVVQGYVQQALAVSSDPEHRFELALRLGEVQTAHQLASEAKV